MLHKKDGSCPVILRPNLSKSVRSDFELISDRWEHIGGPAEAEGGHLGVGPQPNEPTS